LVIDLLGWAYNAHTPDFGSMEMENASQQSCNKPQKSLGSVHWHQI
jgi:hypothetical protein